MRVRTRAAALSSTTLRSWGPVAVPVAAFLAAAVAFRWTTDDGIIHLRVVQQLLDGNGPVFNAGERVEASTSPLWVLFLTALGFVLPGPLEYLAVAAGIALSVLGVILLSLGTARLFTPPADAAADEGPRWWVPVGLLFPLASPQAWHYASGALEGGLGWAWAGATWWSLARLTADAPQHRRPHLACGALIGLGVLIRPEIGLVVLSWSAWVVLQARRNLGRRSAVATAAAIVAIPATYQVFRMGYYGLLVPNTAVAKEASRPAITRGLAWLHGELTDRWEVVGLLGVLLVLAALVPSLPPTRRHLAVATSGSAAATVLYLTVIGGDYLGGRLLLLPFLLLGAPVAVLPITALTGMSGRPAAGHRPLRLLGVGLALLLPWAVLCAAFLRQPGDRTGLDGSTGSMMLVEDVPVPYDRAWVGQQGVYYAMAPLDGAEPAPGREPVVFSALGIGVPAFAAPTDRAVVDLLGLAEPLGSHFRLAGRGELAGHEKPMPLWWFLARYTAEGSEYRVAPDTPTATAFFSGDYPEVPPRPLAEHVRLARAALECGPVRDLVDAAEAELTPGRFVRNVLGAPGRTLRRIHPDPAVYVDESGRCRD